MQIISKEIIVVMRKVVGIVCEYNPFHNGHLYQINKIKKRYNDSN